MFKSEKLVIDLINKQVANRRYAFINSDDYFDFVFLCGKEKMDGDNRSFIKEQLEKNKKFSLLSEDLYKEFNDLGLDLLTIEYLLLSVCSSTILIVESYGSACELGAFSCSEKCVEKLWVINNIDYKENDSFIEQGPVKKIRTSNDEHVIYQQFDNYGTIAFDAKAYELFNKVGRKKGFIKEPIDLATGEIRDLGFALCVLFDYIRLFGVLVEDHTIDVLKVLYNVESFSIKMPSSDEVIKGDKVESIIKKLLVILERSSILIKRLNRGVAYYTLNYDTIKSINKKPADFSSFVFISRFFVGRNIKELSKITNQEKKEGFLLWN